MALERSPATSASNPPVQITRVGVNSSTIIYTVPAGRVFVGNFDAVTGTGANARINGLDVLLVAASSPRTQVTLLAGTTVALTNSNYSIYGVESDA